MELAKVTSKGQITIPVEIRRKLGVKTGDKILFVEDGDKVVIINATIAALKEAQRQFAGEAERAGIKNEDDVMELIKEMRREA
ncbi:MAG: AbrB/MazE/SpoVT family DNA-binding domain-containing protein [Firmicutes bacterium]|nr:AbrB/MazE/SpoVT family DNA-binding domain-containing protein [Bacillota bacterium]MBQ6901160.1 AbrB/MazE/SpoVT family DNA-binding domain-containing protein [Bacillota bacterium]